MSILWLFIYSIVTLTLLAGLFFLIASLIPPPPKKTIHSPPPPAPAPAATTKSYSWLGWVAVILVIALLSWLAYKQLQLPPASVAPVHTPKPNLQQFPVVIDPLQYDRTKSRGVRVENIDGATWIIIDPKGELVYEFNLTGNVESQISINFYRHFTESQYVGFRVNDIRHKKIFIPTTSGLSCYGIEARTLRPGKNEIIFVSEGGRINMNGDRKIAIH